ncbi:MAG: hypothetical protein ACTSRB_11635 [Candidatus Helarchaeota archaeon]
MHWRCQRASLRERGRAPEGGTFSCGQHGRSLPSGRNFGGVSRSAPNQDRHDNRS